MSENEVAVSEEDKKRLTEITAIQKKLCGLINTLDSRAEKVSILHQLIDNLVAGTEISKIEKSGILAFITVKRSSG